MATMLHGSARMTLQIRAELQRSKEKTRTLTQRYGLSRTVERLHGQRFVSRCQAKDETIAWLLWRNKARLHSTLAYVSPMQFESEWLVRQVNA